MKYNCEMEINIDKPRDKEIIRLPYFNTLVRYIDANRIWERSGSVVERLTRDRRAAGSSRTGVTALCP